jgi:hypothetical protein
LIAKLQLLAFGFALRHLRDQPDNFCFTLTFFLPWNISPVLEEVIPRSVCPFANADIRRLPFPARHALTPLSHWNWRRRRVHTVAGRERTRAVIGVVEMLLLVAVGGGLCGRKQAQTIRHLSRPFARVVCNYGVTSLHTGDAAFAQTQLLGTNVRLI